MKNGNEKNIKENLVCCFGFDNGAVCRAGFGGDFQRRCGI